MQSKKSGPARPRSQHGKSIALFAFAAFALSVFTPAIAAQPPQTPSAQPPQQADSGPSLAVTMQFIQDKLKATLAPNNTFGGMPQEVAADPATCALKLVYRTTGTTERDTNEVFATILHFDPWTQDEDISIPFREVEKIEVMPLLEFFRRRGDDMDSHDYSPDFVLQVSTKTASISSRKHAVCKKGKCLTNESGKHVESTEVNSMTTKWGAVLLDQDSAGRIAKAMVHAVELCGGGKEEPF